MKIKKMRHIIQFDLDALKLKKKQGFRRENYKSIFNI